MLEFEKKIADFIEENMLFSSDDSVLLAVSGGADSIALLYTMWALKTENSLGIELFCAHINHQLRGAEADEDESFVVEQAAELKIPIITKRVDVSGVADRNKLSIETAARKLRIESLLDIAGINNCNCIATGHQMNDNAETILQRLSRGTGFRGLGGIWPARVFDNKVKLVRPLLCVTRNEIVEYLKQRNLKWRIDHTNADCSYRRNYIRHRLLPELQQQSKSSIIKHLFSLSLTAQRFQNLVCSQAEKAWQRIADFAGYKVEFGLEGFLTEPEPVKVELIRRCLTALGSGEGDLSQQHYGRILRLAEQNAIGRKIELPGRFIVKCEYKKLIFSPGRKKTIHSDKTLDSIEIKIPGQTQFGEYSIEAKILENVSYKKHRDKYLAPQFIEGFDIDKLKPPLIVRHRQAGDRFWPLGLPSEKKVGKFLTAGKVPHEIREKVFIVADAEKIIWVWPVRMSEQAKITDTTRRILQLQIKNRHRMGAGFAE
jgi:tRNA(Ile)-lysidine synthase